MDSPYSPMAKGKSKKQLQHLVISLVKYHFRDSHDADQLTKMISEDVDGVQYPLEQFEADKDHESLIEGLARVLEKSKQQMGY